MIVSAFYGSNRAVFFGTLKIEYPTIIVIIDTHGARFTLGALGASPMVANPETANIEARENFFFRIIENASKGMIVLKYLHI